MTRLAVVQAGRHPFESRSARPSYALLSIKISLCQHSTIRHPDSLAGNGPTAQKIWPKLPSRPTPSTNREILRENLLFPHRPVTRTRHRQLSVDNPRTRQHNGQGTAHPHRPRRRRQQGLRTLSHLLEDLCAVRRPSRAMRTIWLLFPQETATQTMDSSVTYNSC